MWILMIQLGLSVSVDIPNVIGAFHYATLSWLLNVTS